MSSSTSIVGVRDLNERRIEMNHVRIACERAGIEAPVEVREFFESGKHDFVDIESAITELDDQDMQDVWEVDLSKIPPGVKAIRFINSY